MKLRNLLGVLVLCTASGLMAMDDDWFHKAKILHDECKKSQAKNEQLQSKLIAANNEADEYLTRAEKNLVAADALEQKGKKLLKAAEDKYRVGVVYLTLGLIALACCLADRCYFWYQRNQEQLETEEEEGLSSTAVDSSEQSQPTFK